MANRYAEIINTLELAAGLPESSSRYSAEDMLLTINKSMQQNIVPQLMQLNEEYLLTSLVLPLTENGVKVYPTGFIPISPRAYGHTIRSLSFQADGQTIPTVSIPYVEVRDVHNFNRNNTSITNGIPTAYHFYNNGIKLLGNPEVLSGTVHINFTLNPSTLVSSEVAGTISTVSWSGTQLIITLPTVSVPAALGSYIADGQTKLLDITNVPSGAVQIWDKRATRTDNSGTTTFTFQVAPDLTANKTQELKLMLGATGTDLVVSPANQTSITNLPTEYDNLLILDVAKRVWASLGDVDKAAQFAQLYVETLDRLTSAMGSRSKGEPKVIANRSGVLTALKGRVYGRGWW